MRIVCPTCDAKYEVQDRLLRPGRPTRCTRCGHQWVPLAVEDAPALLLALPPPPPPPPDPVPVPVFTAPVGPTAMDRLSHPPVKPRRSWILRLAWVVTILMWSGLAVGLYIERVRVMAVWPPSQRFYALIGLAPTAETPHPAPEPK